MSRFALWGRMVSCAPHTFREGVSPALIGGRTPWSARVPLDPLLANEISIIHTAQADGGVGCGPRGSALQSMQTVRYREKYAALGWYPARRLPIDYQSAQLPHRVIPRPAIILRLSSFSCPHI